MKRTDLLRHLEKAGCELLREGARHSVYVNRNAKEVLGRAKASGD